MRCSKGAEFLAGIAQAGGARAPGRSQLLAMCPMSVDFSVEPISAFSRTNARLWGDHAPLLTDIEALGLHLLPDAGVLDPEVVAPLLLDDLAPHHVEEAEGELEVLGAQVLVPGVYAGLKELILGLGLSGMHLSL